MAGGHRAEVFPSHIEYLKPPRKKKKKNVECPISTEKSTVVFRGKKTTFKGKKKHVKKARVKQNQQKKKYTHSTPLERYKTAEKCAYFDKNTHRCKLIKKKQYLLDTCHCRILGKGECILKKLSKI